MLMAAGAVFLVVTALSFRSLAGHVEMHWWVLPILLLVTGPLTQVANAAEFRYMGLINGHRIGWLDSVRLTVAASAANLLPLPGGVVIRTAALRQRGSSYRRALAANGVAGLIWMPAFFGNAYTYGTTFQAGLGFTGIAVALLGRNQPVGMVFGALLFAFLTAQSNSLTLLTDISASVVQITQGVAVLAVVVAYELVRRYRVQLEQRAVANAPRVQAEEVSA